MTHSLHRHGTPASLKGDFVVVERVARKIDTVFSVGCISRCADDGKAPVAEILDRAGVARRPNGKVNIGLGWSDGRPRRASS